MHRGMALLVFKNCRTHVLHAANWHFKQSTLSRCVLLNGSQQIEQSICVLFLFFKFSLFF
jgi:hypothetical protein